MQFTNHSSNYIEKHNLQRPRTFGNGIEYNLYVSSSEVFEAIKNGMMYFVCPLDFLHAENHQSDRKQLCKFVDNIKRSKVDEIPRKNK